MHDNFVMTLRRMSNAGRRGKPGCWKDHRVQGCCLAVYLVVIMLCAGLRVHAQTITLELKQPGGAYSLTPADLKYNKDFAWSYTLDDGYVSAWLVAFPYFTGGRVAPSYTDQWGHDQGGDSGQYPGLFFTDGCGHRQPFQAALAINAKSITRADSIVQRGNLSWQQLTTIYTAGWDIFNHGYTHATGAGLDEDAEVRRNNQAVAEHLGCNMSQFVVPGGKGDSISEGPYTLAAFAQGMQAVHCGRFPQYWMLPEGPSQGMPDAAGVPRVAGAPGVREPSGLSGDSTAWRQVRVGREFLSSKILQAQGDTLYFGELSRLLATGKKFWINIFSHSVGNADLWGISLQYADFKSFFDKLAARYGEKGMDNMWMASYQAVQEYVTIRHSLRYTVEQDGRRILLHLDTANVPSGLRHRSMTFVWKSDQPVGRVQCRGCRVESYSSAGGAAARGGVSQIININW